MEDKTAFLFADEVYSADCTLGGEFTDNGEYIWRGMLEEKANSECKQEEGNGGLQK